MSCSDVNLLSNIRRFCRPPILQIYIKKLEVAAENQLSPASQAGDNMLSPESVRLLTTSYYKSYYLKIIKHKNLVNVSIMIQILLDIYFQFDLVTVISMKLTFTCKNDNRRIKTTKQISLVSFCC